MTTIKVKGSKRAKAHVRNVSYSVHHPKTGHVFKDGSINSKHTSAKIKTILLKEVSEGKSLHAQGYKARLKFRKAV